MDTNSMIRVLRADGPRPDLAAHLMLFGQFVGAWDVDIANIQPNGAVVEVKGEWHFGWALEGRAIIDVWIAPRLSLRDASGSGGYGTTVRFYDPAIDAWRSTWLEPTHAVVQPFIGRVVAGEIVLEGRFEDAVLTRWIFSEITPTSFHWRAMESRDDGSVWTKVQEMVARRVSAYRDARPVSTISE